MTGLEKWLVLQIILAPAFFLAPNSGGSATQPLQEKTQRLEQIDRTFETFGPQKVLLEYFDCDHGIGYNLVETGAPSMVRIATKLVAFSDGCKTELLHSSLATALSVNPKAVLPYVDTTSLLSKDQICVPLMIEVPKEEAIRRLISAEMAIRGVKEKSLRRNRDACIRSLEAAVAAVKSSIK